MSNKELSFESNLWSKCETLETRFMEKIKCCKNFINLLNSISDSLNYFSTSIKKSITKYSKIYLEQDSDSTLSKGLQKIINNLQLQAKQYETISDWLKRECLEGFDDFLNDYCHQEKKVFSTYKLAKKNLNSELKVLESYKEKYYDSAYNAEKALIVANKYKFQMNKFEDENNLINAIEASKEQLNKAKIHESEYIRKIDSTNKLLEIKVNSEKEMLTNFKTFEECINAKLQSIHNSYIFIFQDVFNNINQDLNKLYTTKSEINVSSDLNEFIIKNKNNEKQDSLFSFKPYSANIFKKTDENNSLIIEVVSELQKNLKDFAPNYNPEKQKRALEITFTTKSLFENNNEKSKQKILDCLDNKFDRDCFILALNQQRTKTYEYPFEVISSLKDIILKILDLSSNEIDYGTIKNCIILCQTYFYIDNNEKKHFLFEDIRDYHIFKNIDFWNNFIEDLIQSTLKTKILGDLQDGEEKKKVINNTVFPELLHYSNDMLEFRVDKDQIIQLVDDVKGKYGLFDDLYNIIIDNINSVQN